MANQMELVEIGQAMNAQDPRGTAFPLFVVEHKIRRYVAYADDYDVAERKEEPEKSDLCFDCQNTENELPEECENCEIGAFNYYKTEREIDTRAGVFFTAEACDNHIAANNYHYGENARSYAISAWRNPEMQTVLNYLSKLGSPDGVPTVAYGGVWDRGAEKGE